MKDHVHKLIELTGASTPSIEDAIAKAVKLAHKAWPYAKALRGGTFPPGGWWTDRQSQPEPREHFCRHVGGESKSKQHKQK